MENKVTGIAYELIEDARGELTVLQVMSEIVGHSSIYLAAQFLHRPACALLIVTMIVAGKLGHKGAGYLITNDPPGAEYTINLAVICFVLLLLGPGAFSLDALIF